MFHPNDEVLQKYADLLVKFALHSGEGVKPGEVVQCAVPDIAKPMLAALQKSVLRAGAHPLLRLLPTGLDRTFFELANADQLKFFPKKYVKARIDTIDHTIGIIAEHDLKELEGIDPQKIMLSQEARNKPREWMMDKEYAGNFTWTVALYPTQAAAEEAGMTVKDYWSEIVHACYLDEDNPVKIWKSINTEQERIKNALSTMPIAKLHIIASGTDLWLRLGDNRRWVGGGGRNIPSFEIFTSPDWRGTEGMISFNQPLYRYGSRIEGISLKFKKGKVVEAKAATNEKLLKQMLAWPNADKVGEFSLTDARMSRVRRFMANTLFDENMGGTYGNTHIAVGMSYKDAYAGDIKTVAKVEWKRMGFNDSGEHCDIVATTDRTVTVVLDDGSEKIIFADGKFTV